MTLDQELNQAQTSMMRRIPLRWKVLLAILITCALSCFLAWGILLTSFCSTSRTRVPDTGHDIAYNCHGMTVFISHLEAAMRGWLIPIGGVFIVLSLLVALRILIATIAVKIDVSVNITDASKHEHLS
jgi:hypothetical protein